MSFQGSTDLIFPFNMSLCMFVFTSICVWQILPFILAISVDDCVPGDETSLSGQYIIFIYASKSGVKHQKPLCHLHLYITKFFSDLCGQYSVFLHQWNLPQRYYRTKLFVVASTELIRTFTCHKMPYYFH